MLVIGDNFSYGGAKPLDARLKYSTTAEMKAVADATMYDGCMAYCTGTEKTYQWKSTNTVDETLGRWREFSSGGGGGSTYTAGDGITIENNEIATAKSEAGDIDEIIDVYPQAGNLVSIVNAFNRGDIYSTSEKMIGQWQDGKPLYQRVYNLSSTISVSPTTWTATGINISDVSAVVSCSGGDAYTNCPLIGTKAGDNTLKVVTSRAETTSVTYITLQYTKTTDTAISIGETTEYSTDEKVVGTWIDGKPIYQKTVTGLSYATTDIRTYGIIVDELTIPNSDRLIDCKCYEGTEKGSKYIYAWSEVGFNANDKLRIINDNGNTSRTIVEITIQYTKTT